MAYRNKLQAIDALKPDIAVIQEISRKDIEAIDAPFTHWVGNSPHKGLGVIGFADHHYSVADTYNDDFPWFIPLIVDDLHVLVIWACVKSNARRYVRLIHEAADHYAEFLSAPRTVVIGDFNSNTIFDRKHQKLSHTYLVQRLGEIGISSTYHHQMSEVHGAESMPTFFMYRAIDKPYHFDYAFVSSELLPNSHLEIGTPEIFAKMSDHLPLILDIAEFR